MAADLDAMKALFIGKNFDSLLQEAAPLVGNASRIFTAQYQAYQKKEMPTVADPKVKEIPIVESDEKLIDINNENFPRINLLPNPSKPFESANYNSGYPCASKIRLTLFNKLKEMLKYLDTMAPHFGLKAGQLSIKVFEGLRDIKTQETLFNDKLAEIRAANEIMTEEDAFKETCKWVSPVKDNVPVHSTGGAVDIRLWDTRNNKFLDMGSFGVIWGANPNAPTFSEGLTEEQTKNRSLMIMAGTQAGLVNYPYEWWHFSSGDRYAAYWLEADQSKRKAIYGGVSL